MNKVIITEDEYEDYKLLSSAYESAIAQYETENQPAFFKVRWFATGFAVAVAIMFSLSMTLGGLV